MSDFGGADFRQQIQVEQVFAVRPRGASSLDSELLQECCVVCVG
jgi:hypothetical protein